jgi:hypothetical protein
MAHQRRCASAMPHPRVRARRSRGSPTPSATSLCARDCRRRRKRRAKSDDTRRCCWCSALPRRFLTAGVLSVTSNLPGRDTRLAPWSAPAMRSPCRRTRAFACFRLLEARFNEARAGHPMCVVAGLDSRVQSKNITDASGTGRTRTRSRRRRSGHRPDPRCRDQHRTGRARSGCSWRFVGTSTRRR